VDQTYVRRGVLDAVLPDERWLMNVKTRPEAFE
jgi:hypothetical protein